MLNRTDAPYHKLTDVKDIWWVGCGLENKVLETEAFGDYAGAFHSELECRDTIPARRPYNGLVLVGKRFGDNVGFYSKQMVVDGGRYGEETGNFAERLLIIDGTFENLAGSDAGQITILDGTFNGITAWVSNASRVSIMGGTFNAQVGEYARELNVYGGTFNSFVGNCTKQMRIRGGIFNKPYSYVFRAEMSRFEGGDFAENPYRLARDSRDNCNNAVVWGKVESYKTAKGEKRWRIVPFTSSWSVLKSMFHQLAGRIVLG